MVKTRYSLFALFLLLLSLVGIFGSITYLLFGLTIPLRIGVVLISIIVAICLKKYLPTIKKPEGSIRLSTRSTGLITVYGFLGLFGLNQIIHSQSGRPLLTPWETLPSSHFLIYGLATLCLLLLLPLVGQRLQKFLLIIHYGWSYCFAVIIYKIGYGFDPFIHQATIQAIEQLGKIYPTTVYYLGQYSLVTTLHLLFGWTITWWDKLLVPLLAMLLLPMTMYKTITANLQNRGLIILSLLILPFSIFIVTTPQNLAYLLLAIIVFYSLRPQENNILLMWLLGILALFTQPIAGIPAVLFVAYITAKRIPSTTCKKIILGSITTGFIFALPLALYIFTHQSGTATPVFTRPDFSEFFSFLIPTNPQRESLNLNLVYFFASIRGLIFLGIIFAGVIIARQKKLGYLVTYGLPALAVFVSALITNMLNFHFLINYERSDYAYRLLTVAVIFSLPFFVLALEDFFTRLAEQKKYIRLTWLIFLAALITASLYLSYPRFDHYHNSHGYASSEADLAAVRWINQNAGNTDYIVLANQQTSALAIREFGFKAYHNNLFYYPVPTGGPLYQYYLAIVKNPQRQDVTAAMTLTDVNQVYVVLNDYWFDAKKIGPEIKAIANETTVLQDGQITVYYFKK